MTATVEAPASCASCGAPLSGAYCSRCGEEVIDRHTLTIGHFVSHHLLHEFTHVDGKIVTTFRSLFTRPGLLTEEFFAGRRRAYINPVRLLLTGVILFALLSSPGNISLTVGPLRLSLLPPPPPSDGLSIDDTAKRLDMFGLLAGRVARARQSKDVDSHAAVEKFHHELKTYGTALSFGNVALLAALLFVLFRARRPLLVEHVVFSLHVATFVLLFGLITSWAFRLAGMAGLTLQMLAAMAILVPPVQLFYLHRALLRFYYPPAERSVPWWSGAALRTKLAALVVFLANALFITIVYGLGAAIALARL